MRIGNWTINDREISWAGETFHRFVIPVQELDRTTRAGPKGSLAYEWILLATDEDWLTEDDLYDLNYAFVFAFAKFGSDFNYEVFDATLGEQYEQFEAEEREDPDQGQ